MEVKKYIQENEERFLDELFSLIRIPSISAQSCHKNDIQACAERWKELLLEAGADSATVMPSTGNPLVYGEKIVDPTAPTVSLGGAAPHPASVRGSSTRHCSEAS